MTDPKNSVNKVVITFRVTVPDGVGNSVNNQGTSLTDTNGDGSFADETTSASDSTTNIASWSRNSAGAGVEGGGVGVGIPVTGLLPSTGFAPGVETPLSSQPLDEKYFSLGDLWLEIPKLGVQIPIVGVPQAKGSWDITWLGDQVGYLDGTALPDLVRQQCAHGSCL